MRWGTPWRHVGHGRGPMSIARRLSPPSTFTLPSTVQTEHGAVHPGGPGREGSIGRSGRQSAGTSGGPEGAREHVVVEKAS